MSTVLRRVALGGLLVLAAVSAGAQPSPVQARSDADRIVAERVLRLGGAVILEGQTRLISDLDDLPDTAFRLHTLDLVGVSMGAWGLKDELSRLPALKQLMQDMLLNSAGSLEAVPANEQIAIGITLFYWRGERIEGLPTQIVMHAPRRVLASVRSGITAKTALATALTVEEF